MSRFPPVSGWVSRTYSARGLWDGRLLDGYVDEVGTVTPDRLAVVDGATRLSYSTCSIR